MIIPGVLSSATSGHLWSPSQDYVSISTGVVDASGSTTVTFSSIPTTYTHLQIRVMAKGSTFTNPTMTFNADSGANYSDHLLYGDGSAAGGANNINYTVMLLPVVYSTQPGCMIIDIFDAFNTSKYKTVRALGGTDNNGSGIMYLFSNLWRSTAAINSISFGGTTFAQYSSFALYGVK